MEMFEGEIEADESYFGGTRKGKRGRGAVGKTAVFGLLKRDSKVYTVVIIFQLSIIELGFMYHE
ncbi:insertion element IS1016 transposase [Glaesserella parasuis gx033]|nr:insertion element IS1016 transposase [Glaesserella parasuis gx033]